MCDEFIISWNHSLFLKTTNNWYFFSSVLIRDYFYLLLMGNMASIYMAFWMTRRNLRSLSNPILIPPFRSLSVFHKTYFYTCGYSIQCHIISLKIVLLIIFWLKINYYDVNSPYVDLYLRVWYLGKYSKSFRKGGNGCIWIICMIKFL